MNYKQAASDSGDQSGSKRAIDLSSPEATRIGLGVLMNTLVPNWNLSPPEVAELMGESVSSVRAWQERVYPDTLSPTALIRLSHALNVYADLASVLGSRERAFVWIRKPNQAPLFGGVSALQYLLDRHGAEAAWQQVAAWVRSPMSGDFS